MELLVWRSTGLICLANNKKPDVMETEVSSPKCSDENRTAETSEDRSKGRPVSNTRDKSLQRNAQEVPTNPSSEPRMMDYCDSYPITNYQYRYEQLFHVKCSCVDYFTCRKYMPRLDGCGNLKYGGYHAEQINLAHTDVRVERTWSSVRWF